jgi:hypothetical protein
MTDSKVTKFATEVVIKEDIGRRQITVYYAGRFGGMKKDEDRAQLCGYSYSSLP